LCDLAASLVSFGDPAELQSVLESRVVEERMQKTLLLLKKELANAKLQHRINSEVSSNLHA
jgi:Lon-like ATP-dependent protease